MESRITNNIFLKVEIINHLKTGKNPMTEDEFELYCKSKDICIGIVSKLKVSPYYFNKSGSKLAYQFLDIDTNKISPISNIKTGKVINKNIEKYKITWV
tara:strand:- start:38 stop:334 length:297 start_codon:yes stop_codon:yes gene_type:complete